MRRLLGIAVLLAACGAALAAESLTETVLCPNTPLQRGYDANHPWSWPRIGNTLQARIEAGDFAGAYGDVLLWIETSPHQIDASRRERFLAGARKLATTPGTRCAELGIEKPTLFGGGASSVFAGDDRVELDTKCDDPIAVDQADELRYAANALENLCTAYGSPARRATLERIVRIDDEFDRYLFEGFPMFPWEAAVNGWTLAHRDIAKGPPDQQVVLFHPAPAVTLGTRTFRDAQPDMAVAVDVIGWVRYVRGSGHTRWWGVTAVAATANDRGAGFGVGFVYGPMRLAVVNYDNDANGRLTNDRASVLVGVDLYKYLGEKYRKYTAYREKVRTKVRELKGWYE